MRDPSRSTVSLSLGLSLLATACGPSATQTGSASVRPAPPPTDDEPPAEEAGGTVRALCEALDLEGDLDRCEARHGVHDLANGDGAWILEAAATDPESGQRVSIAYLVIGPSDAPELEVIAAGEDDGNGGEWTEYALGELTGEGDTVTVDFTEIYVIRGCTGDPSCFDDDSNLTRQPDAHRVVCQPIPEEELEYREEDEGRYACERAE